MALLETCKEKLFEILNNSEIEDNEENNLLLDYSMSCRNFEYVKIFVKNGFKLNITKLLPMLRVYTILSGKLDNAIINENNEFIEFIIENSAEIDFVDDKYKTIFMTYLLMTQSKHVIELDGLYDIITNDVMSNVMEYNSNNELNNYIKDKIGVSKLTSVSDYFELFGQQKYDEFLENVKYESNDLFLSVTCMVSQLANNFDISYITDFFTKFYAIIIEKPANIRNDAIDIIMFYSDKLFIEILDLVKDGYQTPDIISNNVLNMICYFNKTGLLKKIHELNLNRKLNSTYVLINANKEFIDVAKDFEWEYNENSSVALGHVKDIDTLDIALSKNIPVSFLSFEGPIQSGKKDLFKHLLNYANNETIELVMRGLTMRNCLNDYIIILLEKGYNTISLNAPQYQNISIEIPKPKVMVELKLLKNE